MTRLDEILNNLKENSDIKGLKAEFETEGACYEDMCKLKNLAYKADLKFEIKIGGCGAMRDLYDCYKLNADSIAAPMIESEYALKKFVQCVWEVYNSEKPPQLYINMETVTGIENADKIFSSDSFKMIDGVILGRRDLAASMNISDTESSEIINIIKYISRKTKEYNKKLIVGGKIKKENSKIILKYCDFIETRKVMFGKNVSSCDIIKAIEFEIEWIKNKTNPASCDIKRIQELTNRLSIKDLQSAV